MSLVKCKNSNFALTWIETNILLILYSIVKEANRTPPPFPFIFFKPNTCVWDHGADVQIPKIAQDDQADYEGELVGFPSA